MVCQRKPSDAHHLKFAQPRALGRKVSDEFTVPLCREHHAELHRHGNERAWWVNAGLAPLERAAELWDETQRREADELELNKSVRKESWLRKTDGAQCCTGAATAAAVRHSRVDGRREP
jgi:hypothetical protein